MAQDRRGGLRTLYFIAAAVLAALVPLILFAGLWLRSELKEGQRQAEGVLTNRAVALSNRVNAQIRQELTVLNAMAAMPVLDDADLAGFHRTATRMLSAMPQWVSIALIDPATGRQAINTLRPAGDPLPPTTALEVVQRVASLRHPTVHVRPPGVTSLYEGRAVLLYTPVIRDDRVAFVLAATMRAEALQDLLAGETDELRLLTAVVDEHGRVLARSRAPEAFVGLEAPDALRRAAADRSFGLFSTTSLDGQEVLSAYQRSLLTGWTTVAATDLGQFDALSDRSAYAMVAAGVLAVTLAVVLTVFLFYNIVQRRVSDERMLASRALSELDSKLLTATQESLAEQRKASSEREVLLREIYHRVKNNLQIVQSLLRLGARDLTPEQREPFENAVRRIGAMARVHTLLYQSPDLASIDLRDYLEELVQEVAEAFGAEERGIRTVLEAQSMRVPLDTAVPLAFVAVEVLTNAFKHAFPADRSGVVTVRAYPEGEGGVLVIADDGIGVPGPQEARRSLGLTIVGRLIEQIGGTIEHPEPGQSTFRIVFPLTAPHTAALPQT